MTKKKLSVTVMPGLAPRIENWLIGRDIEYEVEVVRTKNRTSLRIISMFPEDEKGQHQAELLKRFLDRMKKGGN